MSKRNPRVPGTFTTKLENITAVTQEHMNGPGVYYQPVRHDDDCPAISTQSLMDCTCEPEIPPPTRVDTVDDWMRLAQQNQPDPEDT